MSQSIIDKDRCPTSAIAADNAAVPVLAPELPPAGASRRRFVLGASSLLAAGALPFGELTRAEPIPRAPLMPLVLSGTEFDLTIAYQSVNFTGRPARATTVNNSLPGPILRWREGDRVTLRVKNTLDHDSSIHWHGLILPSEMDGVPGMSFDGIGPGETFEYSFDITQSGTYWYHSHSGYQEQTGLMGAIIIEPKTPAPFQYDRELVVLLSDWSDTPPEKIYSTLKKQSHYYNFRERTLGNWWRDVNSKGWVATWRDRAMWNEMRMSDTDIADVTGYTYTYLMNGVTPDQGWLGLFNPGEKVLLRFINGAAMSIFDVRIPGLKLTVVAADGQYIQPVEVDEFRMGVAETYDVLVEPQAGNAYTIFAQSNDRSGYARGTLSSDTNLMALIPAMDPAPVLSHTDMGMDHSAHDTSGQHAHAEHDMPLVDHSAHDAHIQLNIDHSKHAGHDLPRMEHSAQHNVSNSGHHAHAGHNQHEADHGAQQAPVTPLAAAGFGSNFPPLAPIVHAREEFGPHVDARAEVPQSGLNDPGIGLREHMQRYRRRVLTYADIRSLYPTRDRREPNREIELHLTGNMSRYMWSINGKNFAESEPLVLHYGERVRIILVNDTMMIHPIHLHGMWSELETGDPEFIPRKHTVLVQPGARVSYLVTADAKGRWAYHCHLLYHMLGMMREVRVL